MSTVADDLLKKIKANQPEVLTADNDFLGTITKGDMIKGFLDSLLNREDTDIQMIALYGEWGSGKTSLMKYIQSKLDEEPKNFATIFFEAWQFENDKNLATSLLTSLLKKNEVEGNVWQKKDKIIKTLKILTKSAVAGYSLGYNASKAIETLDGESKDDSFHTALDSFKTEYKAMEDNLLKDIQNEKRKIVVFIDDLDRCEPENVLNLLSAIKLFFTFGNRTIFICGLDEKAVDEAVRVKYKEVVKSGEYMEKIFDISFNMPTPNINKMIDYYFEDTPVAIDCVRRFFEAMHFTNPRHIKKVLNKYLLLRYYQLSEIDKDGLIPDQSIEFFRYLTLFIIMLYKFESDDFDVIKDYESKLAFYLSEVTGSNKNLIKDFFEKWIIPPSVLGNTTFHDIRYSTSFGLDKLHKSYDASTPNERQVRIADDHAKAALITLFAPKIDGFIPFDPTYEFGAYQQQFYKKSNLLSDFCRFIEKNIFFNIENDKIYRLWNIFDMAERYL